mmetsp:Transcript_8943/g.22420  ORF Transcript_8943/g.22420 Transcript_8943/m.22420 type:complete len:246 (+) Transcript_8943:257-994(+)
MPAARLRPTCPPQLRALHHCRREAEIRQRRLRATRPRRRRRRCARLHHRPAVVGVLLSGSCVWIRRSLRRRRRVCRRRVWGGRLRRGGEHLAELLESALPSGKGCGVEAEPTRLLEGFLEALDLLLACCLRQRLPNQPVQPAVLRQFPRHPQLLPILHHPHLVIQPGHRPEPRRRVRLRPPRRRPGCRGLGGAHATQGGPGAAGAGGGPRVRGGALAVGQATMLRAGGGRAGAARAGAAVHRGQI